MTSISSFPAAPLFGMAKAEWTDKKTSGLGHGYVLVTQTSSSGDTRTALRLADRPQTVFPLTPKREAIITILADRGSLTRQQLATRPTVGSLDDFEIKLFASKLRKWAGTDVITVEGSQCTLNPRPSAR